jgi:hypothetical protein
MIQLAARASSASQPLVVSVALAHGMEIRAVDMLLTQAEERKSYGYLLRFAGYGPVGSSSIDSVPTPGLFSSTSARYERSSQYYIIDY